jgi:SpoVK/Ycf46/Vps4 family AAA+-type ATPase
LFSDEAKERKINIPKGYLIAGVPGTGKTLVCRAIANAFGIPLISLDLQSLKEKWVGTTESNTRNCIDRIEASKPCVLLLDEVEKSLYSSGADVDNGASTGILGYVLRWLNDREGGVFVVMTTNNVMRLPPELLRKGRLDELFFVDLPRKEEREEILNIHLGKKGLEFPDKDVTELAKSLGGSDWAYTGSEIETFVNESLITAWSEGKREVQLGDIAREASLSVPLCKTMKEQISVLREWSKGRARSVSSSTSLGQAKSSGSKKKDKFVLDM